MSKVHISDSDKVLIQRMQRKGMTSVEIQKKFKSYTRQQIAAIKAWGTMRKPGWFPKAAAKFSPLRSGRGRPRKSLAPFVAVFFSADDARLRSLIA